MITEMNASSTPQWAKDFEIEIMTDYNIRCTDAILITGKVCKIVREKKKEMIEKACKAHCSLCIAHIACRERGEFYCQDIEVFRKAME